MPPGAYFLRVALRFPETVRRTSLAELKKYHAEGQFPPGSMGPKVEAAIRFLENGGKQVVIAKLDEAVPALKGETGTHIFADET